MLSESVDRLGQKNLPRAQHSRWKQLTNSDAKHTPVPFKVLVANAAPMLSESPDRLGRETHTPTGTYNVILSNIYG